MELLEQRILRDGKVKPGGILKVDSFLNHQLRPHADARNGKRTERKRGMKVAFKFGADVWR